MLWTIVLLFTTCYVTARPNFVFILTDDQDLLLNGMVCMYTFICYVDRWMAVSQVPMNKTRVLVGNGGATFQNAVSLRAGNLLWLRFDHFNGLDRSLLVKHLVIEGIHNSWLHCFTNSLELGTRVSLSHREHIRLTWKRSRGFVKQYNQELCISLTTFWSCELFCIILGWHTSFCTNVFIVPICALWQSTAPGSHLLCRCHIFHLPLVLGT